MVEPAKAKLTAWLREQLRLAEKELDDIENQKREVEQNVAFFWSQLQAIQLEDEHEAVNHSPSLDKAATMSDSALARFSRALKTGNTSSSHLSHSLPKSTNKNESQPERRPKEMLKPEYADMTLVEVAEKILSSTNQSMTIDDITKLAFVTNDYDEYDRAKSSLAAELRRGAKEGRWNQPERGRFMSLDADPPLDEELVEELVEEFTLTPPLPLKRLFPILDSTND